MVIIGRREGEVRKQEFSCQELLQRRESGMCRNSSFRSTWFPSARDTLPKTDVIPCHVTRGNEGKRVQIGFHRSSDLSGAKPEIIHGMICENPPIFGKECDAVLG